MSERRSVPIRYLDGPNTGMVGDVLVDAYPYQNIIAPPPILAMPYQAGLYHLVSVDNGVFNYQWRSGE